MSQRILKIPGKLFLLSLLSGVLLSIAWPQNGFAPLLFCAFVPLLYVEDAISKSSEKKQRLKILLYSYLCYITWNLLTTYWVYYSTGFGAATAIALNSLFMAVVFT